ncbi:hypothetical protein PO124_34890 [Bacillus licheniformis]|nr:hypothetical protein [Bacillus licheniformis]
MLLFVSGCGQTGIKSPIRRYQGKWITGV